jgi:hypothetical protein
MMLRNILIASCVLALAASTSAFEDIQGNDEITFKLDIPTDTKIWYTGDGLDIVFSGSVGTDYYRSTDDGLIGQYLPTDASSGASEDFQACGYFESSDGAAIWMQSNADLTGSITTSGDLDDGYGNTLPTWFTILVQGFEKSLHIPDPEGFRLGNAPGGYVADGVIPGVGQGGYGGDGDLIGEDVTGPVTPFSFGNQAVYPNQDAFQMATNNGSTFDLDAPIGPGKMKFVGRCLRNGTHDVAGPYSATMMITFTASK